MNKKIGVIFDMDGTILNTLEDLRDSVNYVLRTHNYPIRTMDEIRRFVGKGVKVLMQRALPEGVSDIECERCLQEFKEYYSDHMEEKTAPYPGIMDLLEILSQNNVKMAVVSNKFQSAVEALNEKYFHKYIAVAIGNHEGLKSKPAPDSVFLAANILGLTINEDLLYYVGDSEVDILTAHNANLPVISVTWGFRTKEELLLGNPEYVAETPKEILKITGIAK